MNVLRIYALVLRQYYLLRDNPTRFTQIFMWVLLEIISWGFISKYVSTLAQTDVSLVFLGCLLLWEFLTRVMQGLTTAFFEDVWSRNFLNIFSSPLTIGEYTASLIVTSIATSALGLVGMILFAGLAFGLDFAAYGVLFAPFLLVLFLMGIALGIFGVALVLRFGPSAEWFIWPIPGILAPFAGVFYPVSTLPTWMQWVSALVPPSYIFEGMRALLAGKPFNPGAYFLALGLSIAYIAVMYAFFISVYRRAVRTGLLARYSAETAV
jgi:ABC-2 type transport system permease protein